MNGYSRYYAGDDCYDGVTDYYESFCNSRKAGRNKRRRLLIFDEYPALTDNYGQNWSDLGIHPILFPKGAYVKMVESLEKLGERAKRSLVEWRAYLNEISEAPPLDQTVDSEVEYCLENSKRAQILANCIEGNVYWTEFLSNHKVFNNLFCDGSLNEFDKIWADWLCNKVIGKDDDLFFYLLINHSNSISTDFSDKILSRLEEESLPVEKIGEYIVLCEKTIKSPYQIFRLIERCYESNQLQLCELLYKKFWDVEVKLERKYWLKDWRVSPGFLEA